MLVGDGPASPAPAGETRGRHSEGATMNEQQLERMRNGKGFIAALDQSGGSTPKALAAYGVGEDRYSSESEMFDLVHAMRTRVITDPAFTKDRILGAILFERTMNSRVEGRPTAEYLWEEKGVVPFLKIDKGLEEERDHARLMKPIPGLALTLEEARGKGIFGTKERSVILDADPAGVRAVVDQQFELAWKVVAAGLVPIIEPEVDIHAPRKEEAERLLLEEITRHLHALPEGFDVMLKLTIPSVDGFYSELMENPHVVRIVALSGGYARDDANARLARNPGLIASFSRALLEGLTDQQSDEEFHATLDASVEEIYRASIV